MARSPINQQLFLNDGTGKKVPIATGAWVTQAINTDEQRRISFTVGFQGSTGASLIPLAANDYGGQGGVAGGAGGFTGTLQVQGTNELGFANGGTGTAQAGAGAQPGFNGWTGALYWQPLQSGTFLVTNSTNVVQIDITEVAAKWVRLTFNYNTNNTPIGGGTGGGSGVAHVFVTAKPL